MKYYLGAASRARLAGVHPQLVAVVEKAISFTPQDFSVTDGLRTEKRQRELVAKGASRTMKSKHLPQADGFGHAVDLVPFDDGPRWEWPLVYPVAFAMQTAALSLGVNLIWGGCWDRELTSLPRSWEELAEETQAYIKRRRALGDDHVLTDGPHYQLAPPIPAA